jgi:hypothetical protein
MRRLVLLSAVLLCGVSTSHAQQSGTVPAKLSCSEHSGNPKNLRAFQGNLTFEFNGRDLKASRHVNAGDGADEIFTGMVSSVGDIIVSGTAKSKNNSEWAYEFRGKRSEKDDTILKGQMTQTNGLAGTRSCELRFLKPRAL